MIRQAICNKWNQNWYTGSYNKRTERRGYEDNRKLIKMTVTDFETKADEIRDEVTKICEKYPLYE